MMITHHKWTVKVPATIWHFDSSAITPGPFSPLYYNHSKNILNSMTIQSLVDSVVTLELVVFPPPNNHTITPYGTHPWQRHIHIPDK